MISLKKHKKVLSRSDKLDYSVEAGIITVVLGVFIISLFILIPNLTISNVFMLALVLCVYEIFGCLFGMFGLFVFVPLFRATIYILDIIKMDKVIKQIIALTVGISLLFLSIKLILALDFEFALKPQNSIELIYFTTPFAISFIWYSLRRNIWNISYFKKTEQSNLLDYHEWDNE